MDTSSHGIGYVLYQIHPENEFPPNTSEKERTRIVRFGSKSLKRWQRSYGPTKLELLGVVVSIIDCATYLRGPNKFTVFCDHQALKPIFAKKMRGAIYERWISILQQFNFDIVYHPAYKMALPDALSRCFPNPAIEDASSPSDNDKFFPYVEENVGDINLQLKDEQTCKLFQNVSDSSPCVNHMSLANKQNTNKDLTNMYNISTDNQYSPLYIEETNYMYDADSDSSDTMRKTKPKPKPKQAKHKQSTKVHCVQEQTVTSSEGTKSETTPSVDDTIPTLVENIELFKNNDFSPANVSELQHKDPTLRPVIEYLEMGKLPSSQKQARSLLLEANDFMLIDNLLFHTRVARSKRTKISSNISWSYQK